jgi:nucleotide-binding universal stress UspA family protein
MDFAAFICKLNKSSLTGVFLAGEPQNRRAAAFLREEIVCAGVEAPEGRPMNEVKQECIQRTIDHFEKICVTQGIRQDSVLIAEQQLELILLECRYADLLLIDPVLGLGEASQMLPASFIRNILSQAECPVLMMPERFVGLDEIIFTYDGSPSSVFAIKQFTGLFPGLADKPLVVVTAGVESSIHSDEQLKMKTWLNYHYSNISFRDVRENSRMGLLEQVLGKENIIIVMGAYGRSGWSAFFSSSHADPMLKYISKALFISHL